MEDVRFGRPYGGGQMTRQLSSSHVTPRSMSGYQDFFRMSSSREEGWLETKIGRAELWERMWVVFDDGVLYYSADRDADRDIDDNVAKVPMDRVISLRTDDQYGDSTIQIITTEHKLYIRAASKDEMRRWLFCFQKSVALVLSKLLLSSSKSFPSTKAAVAQYNLDQHQNQNQNVESQQTSYQMQYTGSSGVGFGFGSHQNNSGLSSNNLGGGGVGGAFRSGSGSGINAALKSSKERMNNSESDIDNSRTEGDVGLGDDKKIWLAELGNGHGKHSALARRRITFNDGISQSLNPSRSYLMFPQDDSDDYERSNNISGNRSPFISASPSLSMTPAALSDIPSESLRRSVWDRSYAERSVVDLTRMSRDGPNPYSSSNSNSNSDRNRSNIDNMNMNNNNDNRSTSINILNDIHNTPPRNKMSNTSVLLLSKSPMIPITEFNMGKSSFDSNSKLAGSYSDSLDRERVMVGLSLSPPEIERCRSLSEESRCSDLSNCFLHEFDDESGLNSPNSEGDMMFDFDDLESTRSSILKSNSNNNSNSNSSKNNTKKLREHKNRSENFNNKESDKDKYEIRLRRKKQLTQINDQDGVKWQSGFCTKLGPRSSNEDRLVALSNLIEAATLAKKRGAPSTFIGNINSNNYNNDDNNNNHNNNNHNGNNHNINNNNSSQISISASISSTNGMKEVEDINKQNERQGYFAVYDGHCGAQAATHLQETLHLSIFNHPLYHTDIQTAIVESCISTDIAFLAESREKKQYSGTTALGAIVRGNELTVFNIGDCHAVLCCNGIAHDMSDPHKPNRPDEAARILAAKGWITEEKELYMARLHRMDLSDPVVRDKAQLVSWVTIHRVCGEISVSRSIGDPDYKSFQPGEKVDAFFIWPEGHNQVFMADLLIPVPECRSMILTANHEFLIIASDGLWDVVSGAEAVTRAKNALTSGKTASEAAEELCDLALKLGSSDNVTTVIIQFIYS